MKLFLLLTLFGKIYAGCNSKLGAKCITELEMSQTEAWLVPHVKPLGFFQTGDPCFDYAGRHYCYVGDLTVHPCDKNECNVQETTTKTSTQAPAMTTPTTANPDEGGCPNQPKYCKLGNDNTMCKYCGIGSTCNDQVINNEMTEAMKQEILDKHNELRAKVANGQEAGQPSATNMKKLIWDDELASNAQLWADQCPDGHDSNRRTIKYSGYIGQNMADSWSSRNNMYWGLGKKVQNWYDEVKDWPAANVGAFSQAGATGITGHYTQVVWAETQYVGCGVIYYKDQANWAKNYPYRKSLICNYYPAGNFKNQPVYEAGPTASACVSSENGLCI